jgi:hypothetical protein
LGFSGDAEGETGGGVGAWVVAGRGVGGDVIWREDRRPALPIVLLSCIESAVRWHICRMRTIREHGNVLSLHWCKACRDDGRRSHNLCRERGSKNQRLKNR